LPSKYETQSWLLRYLGDRQILVSQCFNQIGCRTSKYDSFVVEDLSLRVECVSEVIEKFVIDVVEAILDVHRQVLGLSVHTGFVKGGNDQNSPSRAAMSIVIVSIASAVGSVNRWFRQ
jgi:hypothetical protein